MLVCSYVCSICKNAVVSGQIFNNESYGIRKKETFGGNDE